MDNTTMIKNDELVIDYDKFAKAVIAEKQCNEVIDYIRPTLDSLKDSILEQVFS